MGVTTRRRSAVAVLGAAALAVATLAAGCGNSGDGAGGSNEKITLTVDLFGQFGYTALYKEFEASHPNVSVRERGTGGQLQDYVPKLTQYLATNAGAGDVVAIEEGNLVQFQAQADKFENLLDYGAGDRKSAYIPWKWEIGMSPDGKKLLGLGTDVGGLAMCYRTDLFKKAGLPTDRETVGNSWKTWDDYYAVGQKFKAANTGASFVDAATNLYDAILKQAAGAGPGYSNFDKSNKLVVDSNPVVRQSWDTTMKMINGGLSGNFQSWSEQWVAAFKNSKFATISCPAWMLGVIQGNAGDTLANTWDVATTPGGGGNWGGSYLAVPKQGKNKKLAAELALFLTSKKGQISAFKEKGPLPSDTEALKDPAVADSTNTYFNNAPVGKIFAAGAVNLKPVFYGNKHQVVNDAMLNAIRSVEQKQRTPDQAWQEGVANAKKAAG
jgi:cellobiose transport system substrate-binding protein